MTWAFDGYLFPARKSERIAVQVSVEGNGTTLVIDREGRTILTASWLELTISHRVGASARRITFPDGAVVETSENDEVDVIELGLRGTTAGSLFHRMERLTLFTLAVLIVTAALAFSFFKWWLPAGADRVAQVIPPETINIIGNQSLKIMDKSILEESTLSQEEQAVYQEQFARLIEAAVDLEQESRLIFRSAPSIGPNAFALPNGTIVLTDEIIKLATNDKQVMGVLAHEISHVEERHIMRSLLRSSTVAVVIVFITGDMAELTELALALPAFIVEMGYSRDFEREADARAIELMHHLGEDPSHLADMFELLGEDCGKACEGNWLSSHPDIPDRVMTIREAS